MPGASAGLPNLHAAVQLLRAASDTIFVSRLIWALVLVAASGLLGGLAPIALKALVDEVSNPDLTMQAVADGPRSALLLLACYVAALAGARILAALRLLPAGVAEQRLTANLVRRSFKQLLEIPLVQQLAWRPGAQAHALDQASAGCQILVSHLLGSFVPVVVELCTVVGVLIHLEQPLIVMAFGGSALAYLALQARAVPPTAMRAGAVAEAAQLVRASLTEGLSSPETIQGLGAQESVRVRLDGSLGRVEMCWRAFSAQHARLGVINAVCLATCLAMLLALALDGLQAGTLTGGGFVLINVYMLQMFRPLETLGLAARDIAQALGFMSPLFRMLNEGSAPVPRFEALPTRRPSNGPVPELRGSTKERAIAGMTGAAPAIRLRGVHFGYGSLRPLLRHIDLDVPPGTMTALVGPSGSGKSSLVRLLLRLVEPQGGTLLLDEVPLATMSTEQLRSMAGVVFQDNLMIDDTLAANIAFGFPGASRRAIEDAARQALLHDRIAAMPDGYDTRIGDRGLLLSGGERQRVAIARALLRRPRLLLLDEATSMLDSVTEADLLRGLRTATPGCTTILVAHRLSSARLAQQIAVLQGGLIVECGDHASLLARGGSYAALWEAQTMRLPLPGASQTRQR